MKRVYLTFLIVALITVFYSLDIALAAISSSETLSSMQRLQEQNKIPAYVLEQGSYKYTEGIHTAHVKGKNVFMRSQPLKDARIIAKLTHTDLEYLGEWTHPKNGERWVCVRRNGEIGWIYGQYIDLIGESTVSKKSTKTQSDNKHDNENSHNINWGYVLLGVLILGIAYVITSYVLEWEANIENFFKFLFYAFLTVIGVVGVCMLAYVVLKFIWEKIILPILAGIFLLFGLVGGGGTGGDGSGNSNRMSKSDCCKYPNREYCRTCPLIDFSKESDYFGGYYWCRDHRAYVDPDYDAEYNSGNLKYS